MLRWMRYICLLSAAVAYLGRAEHHCFRFKGCLCRSKTIECTGVNLPNEVLFNNYLDATHITYQNTGLTSLSINDRYKKLNDLTIGGNTIDTVKLSDLDVFPALTKLALDGNAISSLRTNAAVITATLEHLSLSSNKLTGIGDGFGQFANLRYIDLSSNRLTSVNFDEFPRSLEVLDLSRNALTSTSTAQAALKTFTSLTELKIFDNKIHFFTIDNMPRSLHDLDVRSNPITSVQLHHQHRFTLLNLSIDAQSIHCTCDLIADFFHAAHKSTIQLQCGAGFNSCMACDPEGSFRNYSFTVDIERLKALDEEGMQCLDETDRFWYFMCPGVILLVTLLLLLFRCRRKKRLNAGADGAPIALVEFKQHRKQIAKSEPQLYVTDTPHDQDPLMDKRSASVHKSVSSLKRAKHQAAGETYIVMKSFKKRDNNEALPSTPAEDRIVPEAIEEAVYEQLDHDQH